MRWLRRASLVACGSLLVGYLAQAPTLAAAAPAAAAPAGLAQATSAAARLPDPGRVLPTGWQHSPDEAVAVTGDATGLHVLAATEASGYAWRAVATLGDPAVQTDMWIGQACVTASGA